MTRSKSSTALLAAYLVFSAASASFVVVHATSYAAARKAVR